MQAILNRTAMANGVGLSFSNTSACRMSCASREGFFACSTSWTRSTGTTNRRWPSQEMFNKDQARPDQARQIECVLLECNP